MRVAPAKPSGLPAGGSAGAAKGMSSGGDPLAELARLIGQNDPFAEYGRTSATPQAAPAASPNPPNFYEAPAALQPPPMPSMPPMPEVEPFNPPSFARQPFGSPPLEAGHDLYYVEGEGQRYDEPPAGIHDDGPYDPNNAQLGPAHGDFYEDAPPSNRRKGIMVIAGMVALAAIGSASAFGYRTLFTPTGSPAQPPVIKAESAPSKIVPASNKDAPAKLITDRVDTPVQNEKLVSREEKPVELRDKPAAAAFPPAASQSGSSPAPGSGVVSPDAKRVRTIAIHPDQATIAESTPTVAQPATPVPPPRVTPNVPSRQAAAPAAPQQQSPPAQVAGAPTAVAPETATLPARRQPAPRVPPAVAQHQAAAPLSLSPDAPAPARVAPARTAAAPAARTAAVSAAAPAAAASGSGGSYAVQVSSQRSEAEAQAAFRALQGKYPDQLGNRQPMIQKIDLGEKGVYYRAMVGPFATGGEASQLCSNLKAAGGSCLIQRN
jgi:SPOR domain